MTKEEEKACFWAFVRSSPVKPCLKDLSDYECHVVGDSRNLNLQKKELINFIQRKTYQFWCARGWKKKKVLNIKTGKQNSVWDK